jgi:L-threonylcarbamoyladenylate synthase
MINSRKIISKAANELACGLVVGFPTETVYGLGCDATNSEACKMIYSLKGRPSFNPLIIHISKKQDIYKYAIVNDYAKKLIDHFWPGPMSVVVKLLPNSFLSPIATAGLETIAIRMPDNKIALELIEKSGKPIAAPSANLSNYISPTEFEHVNEEFGDKITVINGGKSVLGLESVIIDTTTEIPQILRYGFIEPNTIADIIPLDLTGKTSDIIAPGMLEKHYSPKSKIRLNAQSVTELECGLGFANHDFGQYNLSKSGNLSEAAANLYSMLRALDKESIKSDKTIAVAPIPNIGIGLAINDKLTRAAK